LLQRYWIAESTFLIPPIYLIFFCLPSPFIRTTKSHLTMVPHAGLHSILRIPIFLSFASRNEKSTRGERGKGAIKSRLPHNEIVFSAVAHSVTRSELDAYLPRALASSDLSPSASTLLKRSRRRRWIRDREPISFAKDPTRSIME